MEEKNICIGDCETAPDVFYKVLDSIPEGIMILDNQFRIIYANKKILDLHEMDTEDKSIIGGHCYKCTHGLESPCQPPDHACPVIAYRQTGKITKFIHKHFDKHGKEFFTEVSAYPIIDKDNNITGFIHMATSLSEEMERNIDNLGKLKGFTVDREAKMYGLKKEIDELKKKLEEAQKE